MLARTGTHLNIKPRVPVRKILRDGDVLQDRRGRRAYSVCSGSKAKGGAAASSGGGRVVLGIRREDPARIWERRCPLTPEAVERLVHEEGVEVLVQPCERRVFKTEEFVKAGAKAHDTLDPAHILIGIKETPLNELRTDAVPGANVPRTHLKFSHTHKGQVYNTPLLSRYLSHSKSETPRVGLPTLIDWELLTDASGKRTVGFGWYAGVAGALEGLISTAHLHLALGVASPFLGTPRPHTAPLPSLISSLRRIGETIAKEGTPQSMGPYVIVVTGSGQVSSGALSVLRDTLPVQMITAHELPGLVNNPNTPLNKIYVLHATQDTYLFNRSTGERATRKEYYADPTKFESRFHELIAPYTTLLINGVGWTPTSPRLMSTQQTIQALHTVQQLRAELTSQPSNSSSVLQRDVMKGRCQSFADVSCDIEGGLEFMPRSSTLSDPFFSLRLKAELPELQIMSVDILPTALPLEASESFSKGILPYVRGVLRRYRGSWDEAEKDAKSESESKREEWEVDEALARATIAEGGALKEKHEWLWDLVDAHRNPSPQTSAVATQPQLGKVQSENELVEEKKTANKSLRPELSKTVLMLGSGMVAGPAVEEICRRKDVRLVLASDQPIRNAALCDKHENATSVVVDMSRPSEVEELVKRADVVISLLPVPFHSTVAEMCIKNKKHMVTASYISPAMQALHQRAVDADVLILNEIGLDPGIDHCSAFALLDSLRREGKKVVSFTSFCGGLPAPDCAADVPLKYKFSWSPRGVLSAALNGAKFLVDGKRREVDGKDLLRSSVSNLPVSEVLKLEGLPNRDSLSYAGTYNLQESDGLKTLFRGTIRYPGFSELLYAFRQLGLLDTDRKLVVGSYADVIRASMEDLTNASLTQPSSFLSAVKDLAPNWEAEELYESVSWLADCKNGAIPPPPKEPTPVIDLFATLLAHRLAYAPGERDLVVLHHEVIASASSAPASRDEIHSSSLEVYGTPEHTAMALTVGLPVAIAALRVLDGGYKAAGVQGPTERAMYGHVLDRLSERGLVMQHTSKRYVEGAGVEGRLREAWQ